MQFLLNNTLIDEPDLPADLTVLDYLREHCSLTGTKEGCASGDCGACTVVVASLQGNKLHYRSLNSCIALVGELHGKQLIVVEHLAENETLHPVQQALVDHHASQCGFCTPGFVMSTFALTKNLDNADLHDQRQCIERHLGGNLCRCTGYRPIIDAAAQAVDWRLNKGSDHFDNSQLRVVEQLQSIPANQPQAGYHRPATVDELLELKATYAQVPVVGGCTDFALEITQQLRQFGQLISTKRVEALNYIKQKDGCWYIGSGCTVESLLNTLGPLNESLKHVLLRFGSTQVRNQATLGGNIGNASPIADLPPLFIALNASIVLKSTSGERTLALQDFFLDYKKTALHANELIVELQFDQHLLQDANSVFRIYKISKRVDDDISTICAAFHTVKTETGHAVLTAAFGGMAAIPKRALALEQAVNNPAAGSYNAVLVEQALATDFQPISDARASAAYRHTVACNLYRKFVQEISAQTDSIMVYEHE